MSVRTVQVKSKGEAKYVELSVEGFWTRVQLPPPPPQYSPAHSYEVLDFLFFVGSTPLTGDGYSGCNVLPVNLFEHNIGEIINDHPDIQGYVVGLEIQYRDMDWGCLAGNRDIWQYPD